MKIITSQARRDLAAMTAQPQRPDPLPLPGTPKVNAAGPLPIPGSEGNGEAGKPEPLGVPGMEAEDA